MLLAWHGSSRLKQAYPEPTVGALILNRRGELLLVSSHKWGKKLTIPGGHVEVGERLVDALKREIREEVGLEIRDIKFLMVQEAIDSSEFWKKKHFIFFDFVCRCRKEEVVVDGDEIQGFQWVQPNSALRLDLDGFTRNMVRAFVFGPRKAASLKEPG